jgi:hypothetical protein
MAWGNAAKTAWNDKFRMPSIGELRTGCSKPVQQLLDEARERFAGLAQTSESLVWQGVPWRWTFVFLGPSSGEPRVLAYLIPDPARLQCCVPLTHDQIERLPLKRMKKSIRDGVVFARDVNGICWPTWDVPTKPAMDEVFELVARKHALILGTDARTPVGV